ncbi:hypothetical protein [Armatimonas rosea]|uniref:Uncharacterized protein n=1 Tax=Armatimonas rosea TaxID=685828 RepID=A0A7W9W5S8_ARMRO|nr:hypothetical protein [Armatimonas rosea]MBB6050764.1 hypothetical protein [Armatimonas rosea]
MKQPSKPMQWARSAIENNLTILTILAVIIGVGLRYIADPHTFSNNKEIIKEIGNFILITFVVGFIYENFVNYRYKHEFIHEIENILSNKFNLPISKVYLQRPELNEKAELMKQATKEIIEFGTALRTFTSYMKSNLSFHTSDGQAGRYRDLIEQRLSEGIVIRCMVLSPEVAAVLEPYEPGLKAKIEESLTYLLEFQKSVEGKGTFEVIQYRTIPRYAAICIDGEQKGSKMLLSPYVPNVENAKVPAYLIEKTKEETLFQVYWISIKNIIKDQKKEVL